MEENKIRKRYILYINGLKGLACLMIMGGHFIGLYKHAAYFEPQIAWLNKILNCRFSFLLNEGYWLYMFFVISGYLISQSEIQSIKKLIKKSVSRFLRFFSPILFAYLLIYLIYQMIGFHNANTSVIFDCSWYQNYYSSEYSILDVLEGPIEVLFLGRSTLNGPYWVLKDMFFSSLFIYLLNYLYSYLYKYEQVWFVFLIVVTIISYHFSSITTACLIGMIIRLYEETWTELIKTQSFALFVMLGCMTLRVLSDTLVSIIFFSSVLMFAPKVKLINNLLSSKICQLLGKISWGIYSFHWPLICSAGGSIMILLYAKVGVILSYFAASIVSAILTILLSFLFYNTFERLSLKIRQVFELKKIVGILSSK